MMRMQRSSMRSADDSMSPLWSTKKARIWRTSFVKWTLNFDVFLKMFPCFRMSYGVIVSLNWKTLIVRKKSISLFFNFYRLQVYFRKLNSTPLCEDCVKSPVNQRIQCICACVEAAYTVPDACAPCVPSASRGRNVSITVSNCLFVQDVVPGVNCDFAILNNGSLCLLLRPKSLKL